MVQTVNQETTEAQANSSEIFVKSAGPYIFSSGVSAWGTIITLYPDGRKFYFQFRGRFKNPVEINSYTYKVELDGTVINDSAGQKYDFLNE